MASQICTQCSRVNPTEASYCYFDGARLAGATTGPVNAGTRDFPTPFVFPSGLLCRNFDQFANTCQEYWQDAVGLFKDGMFTSFFGGMGRTDLAMSAKEAARFPDLDRGFDQFLAKLPTNTLQSPRLRVEPTDVNLGQMSIGTDRTIELRLENVGMRLLYGHVSSDCKWLTLGEAPGNQQKLFQFGSDAVIPLQIRGQHLRASFKPLEGQLLIESNGGKAITVTVRVTVPIIPFKEGVLAGSKTPREIAEKARAKPAEAAPFFENGAVADWFKRNGWIYPVQGPAAIGLGAVQQFFEALGLAKAPKVQVNVTSLSLSGFPGQSASATIGVTTQEKKMVYAHATCEQPWVDTSKVKLGGRTATITVAVPSIPDRPGEVLLTKIHIAGNGNQRFSVPLSMAVGASPVVANPVPSVPAPPSNPFAFSDARTNPAVPSNPFVFSDAPAPAVVRTSAQPVRHTKIPDVAGPPKKNRFSVHLIPLGVLALGLLIFLIRDCFFAPKFHNGAADGLEASGDPVEPRPKIFALFDYGDNLKDERIPSELRNVQHGNLNFGLITHGDGKKDVGGTSKKLLYGGRGQTNNTLLQINGQNYTFGIPNTGDWVSQPKLFHWNKENKIVPWAHKEAVGTWKVKGIQVTQQVRIIPGESVEIEENVFRRFYDTCEVTYRIVNKSGAAQKFGMRILLDTLIGYKEDVPNDGVPFTIPGQNSLIYMKSFAPASSVPDFISVYENPDLKDPGVVVQLNLRHTMSDRKLDPPDELRLTKWPGDTRARTASDVNKSIEIWDVPVVDPREAKPWPDSAVVMYWNPKPLAVGATRDLGYTYALSSMAPSASGRLSLSVGGERIVGGEVSVMAIVSNAKRGETVTLELPKGFELLSGEKEQIVPEPVKDKDGNLRPAPMSWRLRANAEGPFIIRAHTKIDAASQAKRIYIRKKALFD